MKITGHPIQDYIFLLEAIITSMFYRFLLIFFPMKRIAALMGNNRTIDATITNAKEQETIQQIKIAINRTKRLALWRFMCFEQGLTAKKMLKRQKINSTIYFGLSKTPDNKLKAHAWLKAGDLFITGGKGHQQFKVLDSFS
ncbi:lasso peptide biosynthesis B2 protein [Labilibaculum euxinus]